MAEIFKRGIRLGGEAGSMTTTTPALINTPPVPQAAIEELRRRLDVARWPDVIDESAAVHGISVATVRRLAEHWKSDFDWRAVEAQLDRLGQVIVVRPDGRRLHAIHAKSPSGTGVPILLVHGWPDSLLRFTQLIPLLTAAGHDVVAPAIPGFGFSEQPRGEMSPTLVAEDFACLMAELGYPRYAAHGGDWGSAIATALAGAHPEAVVALHLTDVPWDKTFSVDREQASPAEQAFLDAAAAWAEVQTYLLANTRNPDTIAMALSDSPVGLLAWIAEMYHEWSQDPIPDDDILALASLYWLTNSVRSSIRLYSEPAQSWDDSGDGDWDETTGSGEIGWDSSRIEVPTGFALFPKDLAGVPPREFAERFFPVERFTVMPRGGHFAALEQPQLLAEDLIGFLADR
jgi:pimeloyl-ACP methyl ester carboxylesterase